MSFATFPASLPYFASLHDQALLDKEIDSLVGASQGNDNSNKTKTEEDQAFMAALQQVEKLSVTTNGAIAHSTSEDPCLDLYASMVGDECSSEGLAAAYDHNADTTLKLIFHCRSIHDGKKNKFGFYSAYLWLLKYHPKTALSNLGMLVKGVIPNRPVDKDEDDWELLEEDGDDGNNKKKKAPLFYKTHGYWKDLLNILCLYVSEGFTPTTFHALQNPRQKRKSAEERRARRKNRRAFYASLETLPQETVDQMRKERAEKAKERQDAEETKQATARRQLRQDRHDKVVRLLKEDPTYRALHFTVARLFATQLKQDQEKVLAFDKSSLRPDDKYALANQLSLAGKWAPSLAGSHDKQTLIATSIAEILFLPPSDNNNDDERKFKLNAARDQYRLEITSVLRETLDVTERAMSLNLWTRIDFSHVPSICMKNNSRKFLAHAPTEYQAYIRGVADGKRKVSGAVLGPHEFVERATNLLEKGGGDKETRDLETKIECQLLDGQWATYIRALQEACGPGHSLRSSLAVCDVSGSMTWGNNSASPMDAAVGLSLTLMALAAPPFAGTMITFSEEPEVVSIDTSASLVDQVAKVKGSNWGGSTNLEAVFVDLLLPMAKKYKIKQEDMVKRLFVFTDMQFNGALTGDSGLDTFWETVVKAYNEAGYVPPQIVWWDLNASGLSELTLQATKDTENVAMVAGFSQNMIKNFMEGESVASEIVPPSRWELQEQEELENAKMTPFQVMMKDLGKTSFSGLVVY
ncbi:hypothetical protein BC941DRAFT_431038, partial [Chlamydoabsidia padenii]